MATAQETLELVKAARSNPSDEINKSFTQSSSAVSGLTAYDLEAPARTIYPVLTPLRNRIPRVSGKGGIQANWRAITGINTANLSAGIAEGNRGGTLTTTTADYLAAYKGIGLDDYASFEADYAAAGFDDVKNRAVQGLLRSLMIGEEQIIVGGNTSVALGTTATPSLTSATTGGTIPTGTTYSVICVALGPDAYWAVAGSNNGSTGASFSALTATVPGSITRTNADATTTTYGGGAAQKSASATTTIASGSTGSIACTVTAKAGAAGYAWFLGAAASERLVALTNINSVVLTALAAGTEQLASTLPASDQSTNAYVFDGILSQIYKSGSGAYVRALATGTAGTGTGLTSNGAGGIAEFDTAFSAFYSAYRLSPTDIYCNAQEAQNISKKVIANGGAPLLRVTRNEVAGNGISAGDRVTSILNTITGDEVKINVHPNIAPGTVLFYCDQLPYKLSGVNNVLQIRARQDYYQIEWPLRSRKWEYGVYADEVLQNYFPPAFGAIYNIANV